MIWEPILIIKQETWMVSWNSEFAIFGAVFSASFEFDICQVLKQFKH